MHTHTDISVTHTHKITHIISPIDADLRPQTPMPTRTHARNTLLLGGGWRLRSRVGSRAGVLEGYRTVFNQARQFSVWGLDLLESGRG